MKKKLIEYAAILGIGLVLCTIDALVSVFIGESFVDTIIILILANYIYKDFKIGIEK